MSVGGPDFDNITGLHRVNFTTNIEDISFRVLRQYVSDHFTKGTEEYHDGQIRAHLPSLYWTTRLPYDHEHGEKAAAKLWLKFLEELCQ